jgi:hypothetical protein
MFNMYDKKIGCLFVVSTYDFVSFFFSLQRYIAFVCGEIAENLLVFVGVISNAMEKVTSIQVTSVNRLLIRVLEFLWMSFFLRGGGGPLATFQCTKYESMLCECDKGLVVSAVLMNTNRILLIVTL